MSTLHLPSVAGFLAEVRQIVHTFADYDVTPQRADHTRTGVDLPDQCAHLLWMLDEIRPMAESKPDKAMRWICFLQGVLWAWNLMNVQVGGTWNYRMLNGGADPEGAIPAPRTP